MSLDKETALAVCASGNNTAVSIMVRGLQRRLAMVRTTSEAFKNAFPDEVDDCDIGHVTERTSKILRILVLSCQSKTPADHFTEYIAAENQVQKAESELRLTSSKPKKRELKKNLKRLISIREQKAEDRSKELKTEVKVWASTLASAGRIPFPHFLLTFVDEDRTTAELVMLLMMLRSLSVCTTGDEL